MPGFSGQGRVRIAKRLPTGLPGLFRDFGNANVFKISLNEETVERTESMSGSRLPFRKMTKSRGGTLQLVGDEFNRPNFAFTVVGKEVSVAAGSAVTGYPLAHPAAVGDWLRLPAKNVSAVVIKDSSGTPKTLPEAGYYLDPFAGMIRLIDITTGGAYTQPFLADFTPGAIQTIGAFNDASAEYFIQLDGVNTDNANKRGICEVFRVKISPTKALDLINEEFLDWDLECQILADLDRPADGPEGQFFAFHEAAA